MSPRRAIRLGWFLRHGRRNPRVPLVDKVAGFALVMAIAIGSAMLLVHTLSDCTRAAAWCTETSK